MKLFPANSAAKKILPPAVMVFLLLPVPENVLAADTPSNLPPPASLKINFDRDIRPILENSCLRCHGPQKPRSEFRLDYRVGALAGGDDNTNDIVPGNSRDSLLIAYVARQVPDMEMPPPKRGAPLTPQQIGLLRAWIDQGANWSTTNQSPTLDLTFSPSIRAIDVQGNQGKFRELEGTKEGVSGGVQNFSATEQISPDEKVSLAGHAIVPDQDFDFNLALDKTDRGFIHAGFDQWRKYYATDGGLDPALLPPEFNSDSDLYVDNGRAWIDFGLDLPRWPQIVLGYEYQYRKGNESTLDWGTANGKNIYPSTESLDDQTHSIKLDIVKDFDEWHLENNARVDFHTENNQDHESDVFSGATPSEFITTADNYRQVQGMDTLMLEKQIRDWWFFNGGFYYSRLSASDFFNQTMALPSFGFSTALSSQKITLTRQSEIFSFANLFTPLSDLNLSLGTQNEWTRETGFGESIPDLDLGQNTPDNSTLDEFKASQNADFRYTAIPFSVLFGDAQFSEDDYTVNQAQDDDDPDNETARDTAADNLRYNLKTGISVSPWSWADFTVQYTHQASDTVYNQLADIALGTPGFTNGYPGFILDRDITSDQIDMKLALRPLSWLKTTLTYQLSDTDYRSSAEAAFDPLVQEIISEGGSIADGRYNMQTYGLSATVTPFRQLYFSGAFTFSRSQTTTADNNDPSLVPYQGNIYTANLSATYAINPKTSLQLSYNFSLADYSENNSANAVPGGLDYQRHDLVIGLTRKLTKNLSGTLRYEFSRYDEPNTDNANNFTANGIFASLVFQWP
jgi:hypothetical protein